MPQTMREEVLTMNERMSALFIQTTPQRREYRRMHPTEWLVTKCMDGRINLRRCSHIPFGLTTVMRNFGGRFRAGWPKFRDSVLEWYEYTHSQHVDAGMYATRHLSPSERDLGCAGFDHDEQQALEYLLHFLTEIRRAFPGMIWPFLLSIDTDSDALILHLEDGSVIDMREITDPTPQYFEHVLSRGCRSYPEQVLRDVVPFLIGNHEHLLELRSGSAHTDLVRRHNERGIALGQGFDWIDRDNFMLILGPCDPALDNAIVRAASIVEQNLNDEERGKGGVLLVSTPYRSRRPWQRASAVEQSRYLAHFALDHIRRALPGMTDYFVPLVGVLDLDTRHFEEIK